MHEWGSGHAEKRGHLAAYKRCARFDVVGALTSQGITFADLSAEAFVHCAVETRANHFGHG